MGGQLAIDAVVAGAHYGLIALSFALVSRTARFFHVGHGLMYTLGAYITLTLITSGLSIGLAAIGGVIATAIIGSLTNVIVFSPLRSRGTGPESQLIASFGLLIVFQNIVPLVWGDARLVLWERVAEPGLQMLGGRVTMLQLISLAISLATAGVMIAWSRKSATGLILRAVGDDPYLSKIRGIRTELAILGAFAIASGVMALAGILEAADTGLTPLMGFRALLVAFTGALLGGLNSDVRAFLGGAAIGVFEQIGAAYLPGQWHESATLAVLVAILLIRTRPQIGERAI